MADIRDVTAGERSSADWSNQVKNAATRALPLDPVPSVRTQIEIYELTGDPTWDSDWELWTAKAKQVGIQLVGSVPQYVMQTDYPEEDVWFVTSSLTTDEDYEATTPSFAAGSWVHVYKRWGNWEVVSGAGPSGLQRFVIMCRWLREGQGYPVGDTDYPTMGKYWWCYAKPIHYQRPTDDVRYWGPEPSELRRSMVIRDLEIDAADDTLISSSTYTFTAADVNYSLVIGKIFGLSPGWIAGTYNIDSVAGGAATLDFSPGTVGSEDGVAWFIGDEEATCADPQEADGYVPIWYPVVGCDILWYTDLVIGADDTISSPSHVFTAAELPMIDGFPAQVLVIVGGTGFTPDTYIIESVAGGVLTLDNPPGTLGSTGGIGYIATTAGLPLDLNGQGFLYPKFGVSNEVECKWDSEAGRWVVIDCYDQEIRYMLLEPLYRCWPGAWALVFNEPVATDMGGALEQPCCNAVLYRGVILVRDIIGAVEYAKMAAYDGVADNQYIPYPTNLVICGYAHYKPDSNLWETTGVFGGCECPTPFVPEPGGGCDCCGKTPPQHATVTFTADWDPSCANCFMDGEVARSFVLPWIECVKWQASFNCHGNLMTIEVSIDCSGTLSMSIVGGTDILGGSANWVITEAEMVACALSREGTLTAAATTCAPGAVTVSVSLA